MPTKHIQLKIRASREHFFNLKDPKDRRAQIIKDLVDYNEYLNNCGLTFVKIEISSLPEQKNENENAYIDSIVQIKKKHNPNEEAFIVQCARDLANMSERSYLLFKESLEPLYSLPNLSTLNEIKEKMNRVFPIATNNYGSYVSNLKKIEYVLNKSYETLEKQIKNDTFYR